MVVVSQYPSYRKNIILSNVVEERGVDTTVYETAKKPGKTVTTIRNLSQAMIPGVHLVKVEVAKQVYNRHVEPILKH